MLTGRGIQIDFVTHTVGYFQTFYQSDIQPFDSKISEERMANLRTLKYFDSLAIDFKFHFTVYSAGVSAGAATGFALFSLAFAANSFSLSLPLKANTQMRKPANTSNEMPSSGR